MSIVPADLLAFLQAEKSLEYDEATSTVGHIRLVSPDELALSEIEITSEDSDFHAVDPYNFVDGTYRLQAVDLVAESDEYEPAGILAWFPCFGSLGTWDPEHLSLLLFPNVSWSNFVQDPAKYLDEQWNREGLAQPVPMPWLVLPYHLADYDLVFEPYEDTCSFHRAPLVKAPTRSYPPPIPDLRDALRLRSIEDYLQSLISAFPSAGVPVSESVDLYCPQCFSAESAWLLQASIQEPQVVRATADGFVRCPHCHVSFNLANKRSLQHGFHASCGTRLAILTEGGA